MFRRRGILGGLVMAALILGLLYTVGTIGYRAGLAETISASGGELETLPGFMHGRFLRYGGHMGFGMGGFFSMIFFFLFIGFFFKVFFFRPWLHWGAPHMYRGGKGSKGRFGPRWYGWYDEDDDEEEAATSGEDQDESA